MTSRRTTHLYQSTRWRKLRKMMLSNNPLCVVCQHKGIIKAAHELDHKIPSSKIPLADFFNIDNLQLLCRSCHYEKTSLENVSRNKNVDCDDDGVPIGVYDKNGYLIGKKIIKI